MLNNYEISSAKCTFNIPLSIIVVDEEPEQKDYSAQKLVYEFVRYFNVPGENITTNGNAVSVVCKPENLEAVKKFMFCGSFYLDGEESCGNNGEMIYKFKKGKRQTTVRESVIPKEKLTKIHKSLIKTTPKE